MVAAAPLRVVFFGTPGFAVPTLEALLRSRHQVVGTITQPDRPRGRGHRLSDAPVKQVAVAAGLPVLQPDRLGDAAFLDQFVALEADLGVVAAYGKILSERVLAVPRMGMVNVHASLLPAYRGAAPVHRSIIAGERETGVTIMRVVKALDAGPMLASVRRPIGKDETSEEVERDLATLGAALLVSTLDRLGSNGIHEIPQDDSRATYAHRLTKADGGIDWTLPAERLHNTIRGLHPWPHAYTFLQGHRFILLRSDWSTDSAPDVAPGAVVRADTDRLTVATGLGTLHIMQIQPEGKRPLSAREFLAGHRIAPGNCFSGS
jgi:methionyl-tRNA formyltransferase